MKKIIMLLMVMCLVLAGCSSNETENIEVTTTPTEAPIETETKITTIENATPNVIFTTEPAEDIITSKNSYTKDDLISVFNVYDSATSMDFSDQDAEELVRGICYTSGAEDFSNAEFYVFDDAESALKAFKYIKFNKITEDTLVSTDNTLYGKDSETVGIVINKWYYLTKNVIVCNTDFIGDPGNEDAVESDFNKESNNILHDSIKAKI